MSDPFTPPPFSTQPPPPSYQPPPPPPPSPFQPPPVQKSMVSSGGVARGCGGCLIVFLLGVAVTAIAKLVPIVGIAISVLMAVLAVLYFVVPTLRAALNRRLSFDQHQGAGIVVFVGLLLYGVIAIEESVKLMNPHAASSEPTSTTKSHASSHEDPPSQEAAPALYADQLVEEYATNEVAADRRYKGNWMTVQGTVESVTKDIVGTPNILLKTSGVRGVACEFKSSDESKLANLQQGSPVTVRCKCDGLLGNVMLSRCAFVGD